MLDFKATFSNRPILELIKCPKRWRLVTRRVTVDRKDTQKCCHQKLPSSVNGWHKWASEIARTLSKQTFRACPWMSESMTLLSNGTYKSNEMLRNSAEDPRIFSAIEMRRHMSFLLGIFFFSTFTCHTSCLLFTQDNFLRSALKLKRNRNQSQ